jgi:hypothetical protein
MSLSMRLTTSTAQNKKNENEYFRRERVKLGEMSLRLGAEVWGEAVYDEKILVVDFFFILFFLYKNEYV